MNPTGTSLALALLIGIVTSLPHPKGGTQNCTVEVLKQAQAAFSKKLGIDNRNDWTHPFELLDAIQKLYGSDQNRGILDVCNALNAELDAMNQKNINPASCFDPLFLLPNDDTPEHAIFYISLIGYLRFHCGAGFYAAASNWQCIADTFKSSSDSLLAAIKTAALASYKAKTFQDDVCEIIKKSEKPYYKPFQDHCRTGPVTYFACESFNQFFSSAYPDCTSECKIN